MPAVAEPGTPSAAAATLSAAARIVISRTVQALLVALVLATLCFAFVQSLPGDSALRIAASRLGEDRVTQQAVEAIRAEEGLERPLLTQYGEWLGRLATGDLGRSLVTHRPVAEELGTRIQYTLRLGIAGWLLSYAIALPLGVLAGLRPRGLADRLTGGFAAAIASLPTFLVGVALVSVFALALRWFPPAGYRTPGHLVLPAVTLALSLSAFSVRIIRNAVVEVRTAFYMTFARIKGLAAHTAFRRHGIRNAAIPVTTYAALQFAFVVDGFVVIETLFNYPGLGEMLVDALIARDVPLIMGSGLLIGGTFAAVNLAADLICLKLDPRRASRVSS